MPTPQPVAVAAGLSGSDRHGMIDRLFPDVMSGFAALIGFLQRVSQADVCVAGQRIAAISAGLLVLVGVERDDSESSAVRLCERLLAYRVFGDEAGRMNRSLNDTGGGLLLVPQFTLAASTRKGNRPGFGRAASPDQASALMDILVAEARERHAGEVQCGRFGAEMQVSLVNQGPVSFWLQAPPGSGA